MCRLVFWQALVAWSESGGGDALRRFPLRSRGRSIKVPELLRSPHG